MVRIAFITLLAGAAVAQTSTGTPAQERVRGDVVSISGNDLEVKSRTGQTVKLELGGNTPVTIAEKADLGDVRDGTFIGTTAVSQPDGTLRALEVHVFPDSMRGTGEGHRPWDLKPGSTMTNATVASVDKGGKAPSTMTNATVSGVAGRNLTLKYQGGEKKVVVPSEARVVKLEPADRSKLAPGAHVFVVASRQPDGKLRADRVIVGKGDLVPPM